MRLDQRKRKKVDFRKQPESSLKHEVQISLATNTRKSLNIVLRVRNDEGKEKKYSHDF